MDQIHYWQILITTARSTIIYILFPFIQVNLGVFVLMLTKSHRIETVKGEHVYYTGVWCSMWCSVWCRVGND